MAEMDEVAGEILEGGHDGTLDVLAAAIRQRQRELAEERAQGFQRGTRVRFTSLVRPKYLIGAEATVGTNYGHKVSVVLDHDHGRYPAGYPIKVSVAALEEVPA